jgi:uncharacterized LabA/DUF88 family protein
VSNILVAVDVQNIWYAGKAQFGPFARLDYNKLLDLVKTSYSNHRLRLYAYTITPKTKLTQEGDIKTIDRKNEGFIFYLEQLGFKVKDRVVVREKNSEKPFGTDWDVGITIDAMKYSDRYDTFVLVSGDGDYNLLLEELVNQGKKTEVITFRSSTSRFLHQYAHRITYLTEDELHKATLTNGKNTSKDQG